MYSLSLSVFTCEHKVKLQKKEIRSYTSETCKGRNGGYKPDYSSLPLLPVADQALP